MKIIKNNWWYSILIILLIIWFLLFLWVWIFNLILNDLKDNKAMWDYVKAYAWAESAAELALLKIKKNWYGYYDKIDHDKSNRSILLSDNPLNISNFNSKKDVYFSYDIWSKVNTYDWTLNSLEYDIIPMFYVDDNWEHKVSSINFSVVSWNQSDFAWNVIWKDSWMSWIWNSTYWSKKTVNTGGFVFIKEDINVFLSSSDSNYFVLFNSWNSGVIKYTVKSTNPLEFFSKPRTTIITSAQVWNYKQNLSVDFDNTDFLNILKYSIYSN